MSAETGAVTGTKEEHSRRGGEEGKKLLKARLD